MPAKKTTAKKKPEPEGPQVDGFKVIDYEGLDMLVCDRCGFDTFDLGSAKTHARQHDQDAAAAAEVDEITEHLAERAQVTEVTDEQG